MKNQITIDSKIGYLRPRTGRYEWATVTGMGNGKIQLQSKLRQGRFRVSLNNFEEETANIIKFLKTESEDYKGKMLLKLKTTNRNYLAK